MGPYKGKWVVMIGFKAQHLAELEPIIKSLKERYPQQGYNIMNSRFPAYDFILTCVADDRDKAHKIGTALVKRELPEHLHLLYWIKEVNIANCNVVE